MGNVWLKIKIWTKGLIFGAMVLYGLIFFLKNSDENANLWYWFFKSKYQVSVLMLTVLAFLAGVLGTLLVRTTLTTIRQIQELRTKGRLEKLERDQNDMRAKAAMLQTRTAKPAAPVTSTPVASSEETPSDEI